MGDCLSGLCRLGEVPKKVQWERQALALPSWKHRKFWAECEKSQTLQMFLSSPFAVWNEKLFVLLQAHAVLQPYPVLGSAAAHHCRALTAIFWFQL